MCSACFNSVMLRHFPPRSHSPTFPHIDTQLWWGNRNRRGQDKQSTFCVLHGCLWNIPKCPQGLEEGKQHNPWAPLASSVPRGAVTSSQSKPQMSFFSQPALMFVVHTNRERALQSFPRVSVPDACVTATLHCSVIREIKGAGPICQLLSILPAKLQPSSKKTRQLIFDIIH